MSDGAVPIRTRVLAVDVLLAAFVTAMQVQGTLARVAAEPSTVLRPLTDLGHLGVALLVASGLVLAVRRLFPVTVFAVTAGVSATYYLLDLPDGPGWLALFVALYGLTAYGDGRRSVVLAAMGIAVLAVVWLVAAANIEPRAAIGWVFFRIGASVMSAALGESVRTRAVIAADALERAALAERTRDEEARARVDEERLRIAREVHDTVAHAIAVINVQSGVTAHLLAKGSDRTQEALETIQQTSGRALREMRSILGVLRDDEKSRMPHPGLAQVHELIATGRDAGLDIELTTAMPTATLPSVVDSAAYRVVQESITNVIRHVGPTRVTIALDVGDDLGIRVANDGVRSATGGSRDANCGGRAANGGGRGANGGPAPVAGRGITGMRERCQLLGGDLDARPRSGGGFVVTARLPLVPLGETRSRERIQC